MEQLVLDPPAPALRLVVSRELPGRDQRYRQSTELGAEARRVHRRVLEWAMAQAIGQVRLDPDALRVVLAVRQSRHVGPATRFTTSDVWQLMMVDIVAWCRSRRLEVPQGCAAAILLTMQALHDLGELHPDSDDITELELALDECTGGWIDLEPTAPAPRRW